MIRNLDQAGQAQISTVLLPSMTGPSPKSYCSHNPSLGVSNLSHDVA